MKSAWKEIYACWLQYKRIDDINLVNGYKSYCLNVVVSGHSLVLQSAAKEFVRGVTSMIGQRSNVSEHVTQNASIIIGMREQIRLQDYGIRLNPFVRLPDDGYVIQTATTVAGEAFCSLGENRTNALDSRRR